MKTFQKKGDCLDILHECLMSHSLFSLIHKKVKPKYQLELEHQLWHKIDSQTKHFTYGREQNKSTILVSEINENHIQETGRETDSFNAVAASWQIVNLEPFKSRGCWRNLDLAGLVMTVSIKQPKSAEDRYGTYLCILCTYEETPARCPSKKPQVLVHNMP